MDTKSNFSNEKKSGAEFPNEYNFETNSKNIVASSNMLRLTPLLQKMVDYSLKNWFYFFLRNRFLAFSFKLH